MSDSQPSGQPDSLECRRCHECKPREDFAPKNRVCRECNRAIARERYRKNPERQKARSRARYRKHSEAIRARVREYRKTYDVGERRAKRLARSRERYRENIEYEKNRSRAYYEQNAEKWLDYAGRRRSQKGSDTAETQAKIAEIREQPCAYCGGRDRVEVDHIVPLSRGGKHEPENLAPACLPCNRSKHNKLLEEWKEVSRWLVQQQH